MLVIVIEAPGKEKIVEKSARQAWPRQHLQVWATGGSLMDLTSEHVGVSLKTFTAVQEKLLKNGEFFLRRLERNKNDITEVWCLTDPDREGEGIGQHVKELLTRAGIDVPFKRIYAYDLSAEGLKTAATRPELNGGMVAARTARRVLDRLIPVVAALGVGSTAWKGWGRVQAAAMNVIDTESRNFNRGRVEQIIEKDGRTFYLKAVTKDVAAADALNDRLAAAPSLSSMRHIVTTEKIESPLPHTAATLYGRMRQMNLENIEQGLQKAYMSGCASYPRTDNPRFTQVQRMLVGQQVQAFMLGAKLKDHWYDDDGRQGADLHMQGAHPGLYVRSDDMRESLDDNADAVLKEIQARSMAVLMKDAVVEKHRIYPLPDEPDVYYEAVEFKEKGWTLAYERMDLPNPLALTPPVNLEPWVSRVQEITVTEHDIVGWLNAAGLGRPSTLAKTPLKLREAGYLSSYGDLTYAGRERLTQLRALTPELVKPEYTALLERQLSTLQQNAQMYTVTVQGLLVEGGLDMAQLEVLEQAQKKAMAKELEISHGA